MELTDEMIVEALDKIETSTQYKERIAMKLRDDEEFKGRFYYCPVCDKFFCGNRKPNYCDKCGQKLDWN